MKKIHTKAKRKFELSTCIRQYSFFHPQPKPHRAKTFTSESLAKDWAKQNGIQEGEYTLKLVKRNKRYEIVSKKK